ncbi:MAG: type II secretion system secretin GspD [Granulosicoccaceae bacterium]|jgi:general secretion pathway protein D
MRYKDNNKIWLAVCVTVAVMMGTARADQHFADDETALLNMENTDITTLISTVAQKTGKNFIVDPRVKGKVTVISHEGVSREELYQIFLSILEVHGFAAVPSGKSIKIIPDASAKQAGIPVQAGIGDEVVTRVVNIDYVNAMQLVPILRPLIPQQGHLAAFPQSNTLIISDRADNIARILRIIRRVDKPSGDDIEVIRLEHASAAEMVRILNGLKQQPAAVKGAPTGQIALVADERTNSILLGGDKAERLRLRALISHLDTPDDATGNTRVVYLKYADAESLVPVLTSVSEGIKGDGKGQAAGKRDGDINIQADPNTNALVITAPPDLMRSLQAVVRQLDVRRAQVLVEAVIAEVTSTKSSELGVQWAVDGSSSGSGPIAGTNFPGTSGTSLVGIIADPVGSISTLGTGLSLGLGNITSDNRFAVLLRAIASDENSNVLSTPSLVTLDNEEAEIIVGQNVPFLTGTTQTTGGLANPFQTIQRQDVGLTLRVKPQINEGNAIKLDITQEVSSVVPTSTTVNSSDIITNKRSIKTSVLADDGSIVVLGGLIKDDLQENESKVPLLGDVPVLGALFRSNSSTKVKTNLLVFMHPVILRDAQRGSAIATKKYNYIRAEQLERQQQGVSLLPDDVAPVLPKVDEFLELPPPFMENDGQ